jgi:hypothetical protein
VPILELCCWRWHESAFAKNTSKEYNVSDSEGGRGASRGPFFHAILKGGLNDAWN